MPATPQEPLTALRAEVTVTWIPYQPGPPLTETAQGQMSYLGYHAWQAYIELPQTQAQIGLAHAVYWDYMGSTFAASSAYTPYPPPGYDWPLGWGPTQTDPDAASPYDTGSINLAGNPGGSTCTVRIWRPITSYTPLIAMFVGSPTVHGVIADRCIYRGPLYPQGAIYGETPPNGYGTRLRHRATNVVYTDPNQAARRVNFQSAGQQWLDLTTQQQADWNAAARTVKPPTTGYALWTQIIATRRLDRIPTLNARIGKTLVAPDFPT
jgi:hypothetical protein